MSKTEEEKKAEAEAKKKVPYNVVASYKVKQEDGTFMWEKHEGTGDTAEKALKDIKDYPKGLNINVMISVTHGDKKAEKNVAVHNAQAILERQDMYVFEKHFRGI